MKIGIVSDLHGGQGGILSTLLAWIEYTKVDMILQLGDFGLYDYKFPVPVYWTYGNREYEPRVSEMSNRYAQLSNCINNNIPMVDLTPYYFGDVTCVSLGGAEYPKGDGYIVEHNWDYINHIIPSLNEGEVDIFISHETPISKKEKSIVTGEVVSTHNKALRHFVRKLSPKFSFSGHWHINMEELIPGNKFPIDSYCLGLRPRDWLIFDTELYKAGKFPISRLEM
jgi:hypothetical protein